MKFYRTLMPFQVISFDLDDTLYDNTQVILQTEARFLAFFRKESHLPHLDTLEWQRRKQQIEQQNPILCEDVTQWRIITMREILGEQGKSAVEIESIIARAMKVFMTWRHKIKVPHQSYRVLTNLKKQYKLVALTNGNVDPSRIGFDHFDLVLRGGEQGRAKPHQELFHQAAAYFNVASQAILHVGDNLITDVQGSIQAGCQSAWINLSDKAFEDFSEAKVWPTLEIDDLNELLALI